MAYVAQHMRRVLQEAPIDLTQVTKGMIVRMRYKKLDGQSKEYWIIVLQPRWKDQNGKNFLLHGLNLDIIPMGELDRLVKDVGVISSASILRNKRLDIDKLQLDMSSRRFYNADLKNAKILGSAYRTYLVDNIISVRICDYEW